MDAHAFKVTRTDAEWRARLTPEQYQVMRDHGTERPGSCALLYEKRQGVFSCAGCDTPLFESTLKFESGTGWPSLTIRSPARSRPPLTAALAWYAPNAIAPPAAAISGMSSPTARHPPACAIASTAWH